MNSLINNLLGYGLPGIAVAGVIFVGVWSRHTENRVNKLESHKDVTETEFRRINEKLDLIVDHFLKKGMK